MHKIFLLILKIFDFFYQRKILKFLKLRLVSIDFFFDIGAHRGETIKIYLKNFKINNIYSFEPIKDNFEIIKKKKNIYKKKFPATKINLECFALGSENMVKTIKFLDESSSSTLKNIDTNSKYFKKKNKFIFKKNLKNFYTEISINQITLRNYLIKNKINKINFLKIDTEGSEFDVLIGAEDLLKNIELIIFEHHYHDMLKKNYTFSDINKLLIKNNFVQLKKFKMPFRKTFEYIYENRNINKLNVN